MPNLTLKRVSPRLYPDNTGTFGVLINNDTYIPFAVTLEPPWKNNLENISCIPSGVYICEKVISRKWGTTFEITDIPNRSNVIFHPGNTVKNTLACILVAEKFDFLYGDPAILESQNKQGKGFNEFIDLQKNLNRFFLTIVWT